MAARAFDSHTAIVEALTREKLRLALGLAPHQPRDWALRNSIPPERWSDVVRLAQRDGFREITLELLSDLYAESKPAPKPTVGAA